MTNTVKQTKGHKVLKILGFILLVIVILVIAVVLFLSRQMKQNSEAWAENQAAMVKADEELLGDRFCVPRQGLESVDVNLYLPDRGDNLPVVFIIHGGAFIAGDADTLDTLSFRLSQNWNTVVVTVDYKLAVNGVSIEYGTQEVVDTVKYFLDHAADYRIDPDKAVLMGGSAGGFHVAMAALQLSQDGVQVAAQVLCYPFTGGVSDALDSMSLGRDLLPPALFILADNDWISDGSLEYEAALREAGISTQIKKYDGSIHGFIEENNPEYDHLDNVASKSPEQEQFAQDAETYIGDWLAGIL